MEIDREQEPVLAFRPLSPERWSDFDALFGTRGACGGCWCMWFRLAGSHFEKQKGEGNRQSMQSLVARGEVPGILAYARDRAVGWCSVSPRSAFLRLERSRVLKAVDDQPVWSVVCFFVAKAFRRRGLTVQLLVAAVEYARQNGAKIVEGYPVEPRKDSMPDVFAYTGLVTAFERAGFQEVMRRSETRPIMRYFIE